MLNDHSRVGPDPAPQGCPGPSLLQLLNAGGLAKRQQHRSVSSGMTLRTPWWRHCREQTAAGSAPGCPPSPPFAGTAAAQRAGGRRGPCRQTGATWRGRPQTCKPSSGAQAEAASRREGGGVAGAARAAGEAWVSGSCSAGRVGERPRHSWPAPAAASASTAQSGRCHKQAGSRPKQPGLTMTPALMLNLATCWAAVLRHCSSRCSFLRTFLAPADPPCPGAAAALHGAARQQPAAAPLQLHACQGHAGMARGVP